MREPMKTRNMPNTPPRLSALSGLMILVCLVTVSSALPAFAGETAVEKLALIRRVISERGEYDLAEKQLAAFIAENKGRPVAAEALLLLGYCQDKQKKNADAAGSFSRVMTEYPSAPEQVRADASLGAADAYFRMGRYRDAIAQYGAVADLSEKPEQAEFALLWRGEAAYRLALEERDAGRDAEGVATLLADAGRDFAAFIEKYPDSKLLPSALSGAGFAFFDAGEYEKALEQYKRFVADFPEDRRAEENRYYIGESLYRLNRYDEARTAFRELLEIDPAGSFAADARAGEAWSDYGLRRVAEAAAGFEEAAKLAGSDKELQLSLLYDAGCAWREAGEAQKAAQPFLEVAKESDHPLNALAWFRLGTLWQEQARAARERADRASTPEDRERFAAMQKKLGGDAAQYFRRALSGGRLGDEEIEARSLLGEVLLDSGEYADAATELEEIAARWPDSERAPWALYHEALAERELSLAAPDERGKKDRLARAAAALEKSLGYPAAKTRLQAAWALADYRNQLGDIDAAREQYRWIANDAPAWAKEWKSPQGRPDPALENRAGEYAGDALFRLGESYYLADDYSRAAGFYQEILARHQGTPQAAMSLLRLGEIAEAGKDAAVAGTRYGEALKLGMQLGKSRVGTTLAYAQLRLGTLLLRAGQREEDAAARRNLLQEAARNLAAVLTDIPEGLGAARPNYYLAEARYSLGQKKEALTDYENSLKADEKGELADAALFGVAWSKRDLGDNAGALEAVKTIIGEFPDSEIRPDAFALMASIRRASGDAAGALADLDRFLAEYAGHPLSAKAELERASALDETGKHAEAAAAFQKFLASNPDHPDAPQALYQRSLSLWNGIKEQAQAMRDAEARVRELAEGGETAGLPAPERAEAESAKAEADRLSGGVRKVEDEILAALRDLTGRYPGNPSVDAAWLRIGEILYDRREFQQAFAAYRNALDAATAQGSDLADKAQYRMAWSIQRLAGAAERESVGNADAALREAARKDMWDKRVAAIDAFESIIGKYPDSSLTGDACFHAAELRLRSGQDNNDAAKRAAWFESAGQRYRQALEKGGPDAPYRRAAEYGENFCLLLAGKYAGAREGFQKILMNPDPDGPYVQEAYWGLGQANLELGAYADAANAFEQALALDKGTEVAAKSQYGLGMTAIMAGDNTQARMEFLTVDMVYPNYPEWAASALLRAAKTALEDGMREQAIGDLEGILAKYGDTPAAAEAREMQARITGQGSGK